MRTKSLVITLNNKISLTSERLEPNTLSKVELVSLHIEKKDQSKNRCHWFPNKRSEKSFDMKYHIAVRLQILKFKQEAATVKNIATSCKGA